MSRLKGVTITCNYDDGEYDAAIPTEMEVKDLSTLIQILIDSEPEMTSLVIAASVEGRL